MRKIRIFETFSGYGSQLLALKRLKEKYQDFEFESVGHCDIDKYANIAYEALHGENTKNYGDITTINWDEVDDFDLLTYSFPCQDISVLGKQNGFAENSDTRSSLLWECMRPVQIKKPKYLLMENVKAILQKKFSDSFNKWLKWLEEQGYTNYYKVLKASDYGVPQERERVFMVSILNDTDGFSFPEPVPLTKTLDDIIETDASPELFSKAVNIDNGTPIYNNVRVNGAINCIDTNTDKYQWVYTFIKKAYKERALTITTKVANCNYYVAYPIQDISTQYNEWLRKPTPMECFRLMDVDDNDIDKILSSNIPKTQLYKLAGNSIVVSCMYHIFEKLFIKEKEE